MAAVICSQRQEARGGERRRLDSGRGVGAFYRVAKGRGGGEAASGGGVLLLIGFEGVKGGRGDGMAPIQWGK
jgi:hypothetical protein